METKKRVVLVTGCSSGVGMYTSVLLAKKEFRVYATVRNPNSTRALKALVESENVKLSILNLDVQNESSVQTSVAKIIQEAGCIDVLVNNAGFGSVRSLEQSTFKEIEEVMDVNFYGAVRCIRTVLPHMRERHSGHILSISSVGGLVGQPLNETYCAAKFALEGLVESMATYLEPYFNIKMTLIEPAGIQSEFVNHVMNDLESNPSPLQEVYNPIFKSYVETSRRRGAFAQSAQTPMQVAEIIVRSITEPSDNLRVQTSEMAKTFVAEKIQVDPTGTALQKRIRKDLLGIC